MATIPALIKKDSKKNIIHGIVLFTICNISIIILIYNPFNFDDISKKWLITIFQILNLNSIIAFLLAIVEYYYITKIKAKTDD